MDGIYSMTFRGAADWGIGMLVLRRGLVTGADASGAAFDGRYIDRGASLFLDMEMTVPAGVTLVTGTPPSPRPYRVPFAVTISKHAIEESEPVLVQLPTGAVNVIVRRLRPLDD